MPYGIWKREGKNGIGYLVRVELSPDPVTGKRRQRAKTFRTRREAEAARIQWLAEIEKGAAVEPSHLTVGEYLNHWLDASVRHSVRATTHESYRYILDVHVIPAIGTVHLQRLTTTQIQTFYSTLLATGRKDGAGGLSKATVHRCHMILRQALGQAVRWGFVVRNVADGVKPPRLSRPIVQAWDIAEARRFLVIANEDSLSPLWLLAIATGMRRGELLGLRWRDVDFARRVLHVRQCVVEIRGRVHIQEPKTASGRRTISLSPRCISALQAPRARLQAQRMNTVGQQSDSDLIFATRDGNALHPRNVVRRFSQLVQKSGVSHIRFHDLRHTHATMLIKDNVNVKVISERLGHANVSITLNTYAHVLPSMQREAADGIDEALQSEGQDSLVNRACT